MGELSKEERDELAELAEFRKWKESQAVEKVNDVLENSGSDTTPFHYQDKGENYVIGNVEDVNTTKESYFLSFELAEGESLAPDGVEIHDVEYETIDEEEGTVLASGFISIYPNARNHPRLINVLQGLYSIRDTLEAVISPESLEKEELTQRDLLNLQNAITETQRKAFRESAVILFGIDFELAKKADDLALIMALGGFLENHQELINEAQGLTKQAKKLAILNRRTKS